MSHFFDQVIVMASISLIPAGWFSLIFSTSFGFSVNDSGLSVTVAFLILPAASALLMLLADKARLAVRSKPATFAVAISVMVT